MKLRRIRCFRTTRFTSIEHFPFPLQPEFSASTVLKPELPTPTHGRHPSLQVSDGKAPAAILRPVFRTRSPLKKASWEPTIQIMFPPPEAGNSLAHGAEDSPSAIPASTRQR